MLSNFNPSSLFLYIYISKYFPRSRDYFNPIPTKQSYVIESRGKSKSFYKSKNVVYVHVVSRSRLLYNVETCTLHCKSTYHLKFYIYHKALYL
jgi:hypothetical protein